MMKSSGRLSLSLLVLAAVLGCSTNAPDASPAAVTPRASARQSLVEVYEPAPAVSYATGSMLPISWSSQSAVPGPFLLSLFKGGAWVQDIATVADTTQRSFHWPIPHTLLPGLDYSVRVIRQSSDSAEHFSGYFTLRRGLPEGDNSSPWQLTGPVGTARSRHASALLADGRVLLVGGWGNGAVPLSSAETYDPATGAWAPAGALSAGRVEPVATPLPDGRVLVTGGHTNPAGTRTAELFDPASGTWSVTAPMSAERRSHAAVLLRNGKVLVVGGHYLNSAEVYDPATATWSATGSLSTAFYSTTRAVRLLDGRVLVTGEGGNDVAPRTEVYDPGTNTWARAGDMRTSGGRGFSLTLLPDGRVLAVGGLYEPSAELFDPATGTWSPAAPSRFGRRDHTATLLTDGRVLVAGGVMTNGVIPLGVEVYDPASNTWTGVAPLNVARREHTAERLANGRVLVVGGYSTDALTASAELSSASPMAPNVYDLGSLLGTAVVQGTTCGGGDDAQPVCGYSLAEDRTFTWTAPVTGNYVFTVAASGSYIPVLSVSDAASGTPLGCSDRGDVTQQTRAVVGLMAGQQVRVLVDGHANYCGSFSLGIRQDPGAVLTFGADATVTLTGQPRVGSSLRILYALSRLEQCRGEGWSITGHAMTNHGPVTSFHVADASNRAPSVGVLMPLTTGGDLELWFQVRDSTGCSAWDSNLGWNFHTHVWQDPTLTFSEGWQHGLFGMLRGGSTLMVDYDIDRLPRCRARYSGYFETWNVNVAYRFDGGPEQRAPLTLGYGEWDLEHRRQVPAFIPVPVGARRLEMWFVNSDRTTCVEYDSRYGQNYVFTVY